MLQQGKRLIDEQDGLGEHPLKGKRVFIPPMAYGSARAFASGFRAMGVDAYLTPPSDHRTLELGAKYTSGDECYPAKVTVGDFMKVLEQPDIDPAEVVFFMPTADGPCRFGQYAPFLRKILDACGYTQVGILSPTSKNGYEGLGKLAQPFFRTGWRVLLAGDILQKLLLKTRPHEVVKGETDKVYHECLDDICLTVERTPMDPPVQLVAIRDALIRCRDRFRKIRVQKDPERPLIGVVGEIFCRLNTFSNEDLIRRLEEYGAEAWLSDIAEWVWYTNAEQFRILKLRGKQFSLEMAKAWLRNKVQKDEEHTLMEPFAEDMAGYEEPPIETILELARPYLPNDGALGEMVLNVGKAVYLAKKGADGIIDISPFTCMNGIVSEAVYQKVSRDWGGIPIRSFYFDGTQSDLDRDLGVYLELAKTYRKKKKRTAAA